MAGSKGLASDKGAQGEVLTLRVERMAYGPDTVAHRADGKAVFVSGGAVPGDVVEATVTEEGRSLVRARLSRVVEPSPERVSPACPYADVCGGCPWAHLSPCAQLAQKRASVVGSLEHMAHLAHGDAEALVAPAERPGGDWGYRNKVELALVREGGRFAVGMHRADGTGVVRVDDCPLLDRHHRRVVKSASGALSYLASSAELPVERLGIRSSRRTGDLELALWGPTGPFPRAQASKVLGDATKATSVVHVLQKGPQKARRVTGVERLSGKGCWAERVAGGEMLLSAPSFFQVSTVGAERLVELALEGLSPTDGDEAMDLYCGAGTFTLPLARACGFVSAVESYGPAVRDLRRNLEHAGLDNVDAVGGDAGREFPDTDADVIVVDPPRAGLAPEVVTRLSEQPARAIAYVSCDPATLARDLARFAEVGTFAPERVTPVDLFPQTFHVETVTILRRR